MIVGAAGSAGLVLTLAPNRLGTHQSNPVAGGAKSSPTPTSGGSIGSPRNAETGATTPSTPTTTITRAPMTRPPRRCRLSPPRLTAATPSPAGRRAPRSVRPRMLPPHSQDAGSPVYSTDFAGAEVEPVIDAAVRPIHPR